MWSYERYGYINIKEVRIIYGNTFHHVEINYAIIDFAINISINYQFDSFALHNTKILVEINTFV